MFFVCFWVALRWWWWWGGGSCGNPFSVLHRGDVFLGFQKHKLMISVCCWSFSRRFAQQNFSSAQTHEADLTSSLRVLRWGVLLLGGCLWTVVDVAACLGTCACTCHPALLSGPLAGNLSIEIIKKNSREEFLWFSQGGIYNGLQAALTSPSLSPLTLSH